MRTATASTRSRCAAWKRRQRDLSADYHPRRDRAGRPAAAGEASNTSAARSRRTRRASRTPCTGRRSRTTCSRSRGASRWTTIRDGEDHTIDKPAQYELWRDYWPQLTPPWPAQTAEREPGESDHAATVPARAVPGRVRQISMTAVAVSAPALPRQLGRCAGTPRSAAARGHAGELAAERLLAGQPHRRARRGGAAPSGRVAPAQSLAALLAADRSAAPRRRDGLPRPAPARRRRRHRRRAGEVPLHPRVAAHPGRVHGAGAARRRRSARGEPKTQDTFADSVGHRQLPHRPASQHRRDELHRHRPACRSRFRWGRCCRSASRTCCRPARTSASRTSPTAATGCIRWSGTSAKRPARWRRSACAAKHRRARCAPMPPCWETFNACWSRRGFELEWPRTRPL